jgi:hypothetical protein
VFRNQYGVNMSLISDLTAELEIALSLEQAMVDGGENLIDIAQGQSTLTAKTLEALHKKLAHETEQRNLIDVALTALKLLAAHGYPVRKVFDVQPEIAIELALKQQQMLDFAAELRPINLGSDGGFFSLSEVQPVAITAKKKK